MNKFYDFNVNTGELEVMPGASIEPTLREATEVAARYTEIYRKRFVDAHELGGEPLSPESERTVPVKFTFNGVALVVMPDSNVELLLRDWLRGANGYLGEEPVVGPYPKDTLSEEELANDARIEAENQARRDAESARYQAEAKAHRDRVEARMANAPAMEFSGEEGQAAWQQWWDANKDGYGIGIMHYAERWARMMQLELAEGKTLDEIWASTSHEADLEGMSGFTQGAATHMLTVCWVHGAELRRLHNKSWGSDATEGTVNPAILCVVTSSSDETNTDES